MKYIVRVADKSYEVEIEDIYARPVIARVAGQVFEVSPSPSPLQPSLRSASQSPGGRGDGGEGNERKEVKPVELSRQSSTSMLATNELTAPLPGTVVELFVKAGEQIESGQVILVIEAMKMKNSIRATRAGKISEVLVSAGETVAHKQVLVKFAA
jgi:biotin carboxyl carrier protein